jgi:hypothetical protein
MDRDYFTNIMRLLNTPHKFDAMDHCQVLVLLVNRAVEVKDSEYLSEELLFPISLIETSPLASIANTAVKGAEEYQKIRDEI